MVKFGGDSDYWLISANSSTYIEEFQSEAPAIVEIWKIASNGSRLMVERLLPPCKTVFTKLGI